jgi:hypothetical protein
MFCDIFCDLEKTKIKKIDRGATMETNDMELYMVFFVASVFRSFIWSDLLQSVTTNIQSSLNLFPDNSIGTILGDPLVNPSRVCRATFTIEPEAFQVYEPLMPLI